MRQEVSVDTYTGKVKEPLQISNFTGTEMGVPIVLIPPINLYIPCQRGQIHSLDDVIKRRAKSIFPLSDFKPENVEELFDGTYRVLVINEPYSCALRPRDAERESDKELIRKLKKGDRVRIEACYHTLDPYVTYTKLLIKSVEVINDQK